MLMMHCNNLGRQDTLCGLGALRPTNEFMKIEHIARHSKAGLSAPLCHIDGKRYSTGQEGAQHPRGQGRGL